MNAALLKKRKAVGAQSRERSSRLHALIEEGFLRELRMRDPVISLRQLARVTRIPLTRMARLEQGPGKHGVTVEESGIIAAALYGGACMAVEGECRACGCTDAWGCDAGCSWVNAERTLCSECVGP